MTANSVNLVKLPTFSGEPKDFQIWLMRFKAFACVNGFRTAVERVMDKDMPVDDHVACNEKTADGKHQLKAKVANDVAMANLMMAFLSEGLMGLIHQSMDADWPNGLACKVIDGLHKRFVPQDIVS